MRIELLRQVIILIKYCRTIHCALGIAQLSCATKMRNLHLKAARDRTGYRVCGGMPSKGDGGPLFTDTLRPHRAYGQLLMGDYEHVGLASVTWVNDPEYGYYSMTMCYAVAHTHIEILLSGQTRHSQCVRRRIGEC